jgi:hypothetical protein
VADVDADVAVKIAGERLELALQAAGEGSSAIARSDAIVVILSGAKDRLKHACEARGSLASPTRSFAEFTLSAAKGSG